MTNPVLPDSRAADVTDRPSETVTAPSRPSTRRPVAPTRRAHAFEMGANPDKDPPFFFTKPPDAAVDASGPGAKIPYPPMTEDLHHEVELVVAIGQGDGGAPRQSSQAPGLSQEERPPGRACAAGLRRQALVDAGGGLLRGEVPPSPRGASLPRVSAAIDIVAPARIARGDGALLTPPPSPGAWGETPYTFCFIRSSGVVHRGDLPAFGSRTGGRDISPEVASRHVFGYGVGVDLTRRDLQAAAKKKGRPWDCSKGFDFSGPVGALTPVHEVGMASAGCLAASVPGGTVRCDWARPGVAT